MKINVQIDKDSTHLLLDSAKVVIRSNPESYEWFSNKELTHDNVIKYALQHTYGQRTSEKN